jgi:hypothetical protein
MPRRQRFKPSRKPKPAIEPSENDIVQPSTSKPTIDQETHDAVSQQDSPREERHPDSIEERIPS